MNGEQQIRAVALEAASRIMAGNLSKLINLNRISENKTYTEMATVGLAREFEKYVRGDSA